jgi:transposase
MIDDERFAKIRRLFFAEHWKVGAIATELGVHRDVVVRAIGADAFNQRKAAPQPPSRLDPYKPLVEELLARHARLPATRLFEMLRDRGYVGSVVQVRRFARLVRRAPRGEAYLRRTTLPGEEAQVDWAHFGKLRVGRATRPLVCFVLVLGWSRALFARFFHDLSTTCFLRGHVLGFHSLGGVPRRCLVDNLKSAVVERVGDHIRFGADYLALAAHYHFEPQPCAPYRGNEKGKVERAIRYLRDSFFPARSFASLADLNSQLDAWIRDVAQARKAPGDPDGRSVKDLLALERERLLPLPSSPFPVERVVQLVSGKTPYLRFDLNDYSIPHTLVRVPLQLRATDERIRILDDNGQVVCDHARSFDSGAVVEDPAHLEALHRHKRHAHELRGRSEIVRRCPHADALLAALVERSVPLAPEIRALLLLCDRYGAAPVDTAIARCLEAGLRSAHAVARTLDDERKKRGLPPRPAIAAGRSSGARPVDLRTYDRRPNRKDPTP